MDGEEVLTKLKLDTALATTDKDGNIYVATFSDNTIIKVTPDNKRIVFVKSDKIKM